MVAIAAAASGHLPARFDFMMRRFHLGVEQISTCVGQYPTQTASVNIAILSAGLFHPRFSP